MKQSWTSWLFASAFGVGLLTITPDLSFAHSWYRSINWRQHQQQSRMYQGVRHGQISGREYRRLEHQEASIAHQEYRFRYNDGHLGRRERAILQHRLNNLSRNIYRARHH